MDNNIRKAEKADIPQIIELLYQVHMVHSEIRPDLFKKGSKKYGAAELEEIINDPKRPIFVSEHDGKICGYIFCVLRTYSGDSLVEHTTLYIDDLCVNSRSRRLHIGNSLYEYVLDFAKKNGCYNVTLNVWAGNDSALEFYKHCGMTVQKTVMEKIL